MKYFDVVEIKRKGATLPRPIERALKVKRGGRVLVFRAGRSVLLVPEDPEIRRMVEHNERILKERGVTVRDVLRELDRLRRAAAHARSAA